MPRNLPITAVKNVTFFYKMHVDSVTNLHTGKKKSSSKVF